MATPGNSVMATPGDSVMAIPGDSVMAIPRDSRADQELPSSDMPSGSHAEKPGKLKKGTSMAIRHMQDKARARPG